MNWAEILENKLFENNYDKQLINFLVNEDFSKINNDSEIIKNVFLKLSKWKSEYLIKSENITLDGALAWYLDAKFAVFKIPDDIQDNFEEYLYKIVLLSWSQFFEIDIENITFNNNPYFYDKNNFLELSHFSSKESCTSMSKEDFLKEFEDIYNASFRKFSYYKQGDHDPKFINGFAKQYPRFFKYITFFKENLSYCSIIRINELEEDETVCYFIFNDDKLFVIVMDDFI